MRAVTRETPFSNAACLKCHDVVEGCRAATTRVTGITSSRTPGRCHASTPALRAMRICFRTGPPLTAWTEASAMTYCRACHGVQPREGPPARPEPLEP